MNKKSFLMLSAGLILFAACNNEPKSDAPSQAQIDSTVNARVDKMQNDMASKNDSIIAAQAKVRADSMEVVLKADSMAKAMNKTTTTTTTTHHNGHPSTTKTTQTTTTTEPAPPVNPKESRFGNDAAKQQQQQDNADKKAARFK